MSEGRLPILEEVGIREAPAMTGLSTGGSVSAWVGAAKAESWLVFALGFEGVVAAAAALLLVLLLARKGFPLLLGLLALGLAAAAGGFTAPPVRASTVVTGIGA